MKTIAVLMAGGAGERFWPASTQHQPKQFLDLTGEGRSMLESTFARAKQIGDRVALSTLPHLADPSLDLCPDLDGVYVEPAKRNTAGALIWTAASLIAEEGADWRACRMAVLPADQRISPVEAFVADAQGALDLASETGGLVTLGVPPTRAETGYGYISQGEGLKAAGFREKPDAATAQSYLEQGGFLWNTGMFFWTLGGFADELQAADPALASALHAIAAALAAGNRDQAVAAFEALPSISIDYALMEKSDRVYVIPASFEWDDVGAWDALVRTVGTDEDGNAVQGPGRLLDSKNCIVSARSGQEICILGMEDAVVVAVEGTVLVCPKSRVQEVKRFLSS